MRLFVDYGRLNQATVAETYRLPRIDDRIDCLGDANVFSALHANCGYWKILVAARDSHKTCLTSHRGVLQCKRMPFGIRKSSVTIKHALYIALSGVR